MISKANNTTYNISISFIQSDNISSETTNGGHNFIYNLIINFPIFTCIQSFLLTFFSLLSDKSYILLIITKKKFPESDLVFFAFLFSILLLNTILIILGKLIELFLYRNLIEFSAIIIFGFIGIKYFFKFFYVQKHKSYNQEINYILVPNPKLGVDFSAVQSRRTSKILNYDKKEEFIYIHYYKPNNKIFLFYIFSKKIFISFLGSAYTYLIFINSALSDFIGVITGTGLAILIVVYFGCYHENCIGEILSEAKTGAVVSFLCLTTLTMICVFSAYSGV